MCTDYKFNHDIPLLRITLTLTCTVHDTLMVEVETMNNSTGRTYESYV